MTNNFTTKSSIPIIAIIIGFVAIFVVILVFAIEVSPPTLTSTPSVMQPASSPSSSLYFPEAVPLPTEIAKPTRTATIVPTNTPVTTLTPIILPTLFSSYSQPLPDLTVSGISDPTCATEYDDGTKLRFSIFVRNIGSARTRSFGSINTDVFLILGQRHYSLDEWATQFNGLVGSSVTEVFNLNPDDDIKFTVVIDLKGNKNFGIEVITNSGDKPIREADTTNNTLIKYFSVYCY